MAAATVKGVTKLLIIRKKYVTPTLLEESGLKQFCKTDPLKIYPLYDWQPENGITHYGYLLEGLKLDDLEKLKKFVDSCPKSSRIIIDIRQGETHLEALAREVSLQINPIA